ncbi:MAG: Do family serine endopeptidase [Pseudomonadota bacterium]
MKHLAIAVLIATSFTAPSYAALPASVDGQSLPSLAPIVDEVSSAVVNIQVRGVVNQRGGRPDPFREFFGMPAPNTPREMRSAGSGVIVDAQNGYILTNEHVIANADEIEVTLQDGTSFSATVVGKDEGTDIAVLKADVSGLVDIRIGNSDQTRVGDFVIAIGNPFGLDHTVTSGIVSALGRNGIGDGYEDFIQTDASINPGNSGGALVNLAGELVGINSAIISRSGGNVGIGFAIPSNMAKSIMSQILEFGDVRRGLLGVSIVDITASDAESMGLSATGAIVSAINPGSAAERAGIEVNDIITEVNGKKIDDATELRNTIGLMRAEDEVEITAVREGKTLRFDAKLDDMNSGRVADASTLHPGLDGAQLADSSDRDGVVVSSVTPNSRAALNGLRAGDVITSVNRQRVTNVESLLNFSAANTNARIFVEIERNGRRRLLSLRR